MESAIDKHLVCPRLQPQRMVDGYIPPFPGWVGRSDPQIKRYVIAYLGVQAPGKQLQQPLSTAYQKLVSILALPHGPSHYDQAWYVDNYEYDNRVAIAYWNDPIEFERWRGNAQVTRWWASRQRNHNDLGYFCEMLTPAIERLETFYSTPDRTQGVAVVMSALSDEILEHGYWGSMRDRIPLSQTDALDTRGRLEMSHHGLQLDVAGHQNLVVIRSGQDWSDTSGEERIHYLEKMEPTLREGMDFLQNNGLSVGCYSNRYMTQIDENGRTLERSFSVSHWHSLSDLERWSRSHPSHVKIFGTFMQMAQTFNGDLKWRGYHEVCVLEVQDQCYQYINCHPHTGLLNGLKAVRQVAVDSK
jgi:aldoxime dehydratase